MSTLFREGTEMSNHLATGRNDSLKEHLSSWVSVHLIGSYLWNVIDL